MRIPASTWSAPLRTLAFWRFTLTATALCAIHLWLALGVAERTGMTCDEIAHVTAGLAYNERADFRLQPENGNLPQRLYGLATRLGTEAQLPPISDPNWAISEVWRYGHTFFFQGNVPPGLILLHARTANLIWSLAIGLMILLWARRLGGDLAGLGALALWAAEPSFLANGPLATSDMCATFWLTATCGLWWRALAHTKWSSVLAVALAFGLCAIAKFSVLILGPALILISALWLKTQTEQLRSALNRIALTTSATALGALVIIWLAFGFRATANNPDFSPFTGFIIDWEVLLRSVDQPGTLIRIIKNLGVIPDGYLYGLDYVLAFSKARSAFLDGAYSNTGWWDFFPRAFWYKTSPALLLGLLLALIAAARGRLWKNAGPSILVLGSLVTVYVLISIGSSLNIGHRHLLPIYPALFIAAGWGLSKIFKNRWRASLALAGILTLAGFTLIQARQAPLAWFSPLAGGPENGWKHLGDSSLDWGQGLPALADWWYSQPEHVTVKVPLYLSYFGTDEPTNYALRPIRMTSVDGSRKPPPYYVLKPGWYAFGATMLQQIYGIARGPWTLDREQRYQRLRQFSHLFEHMLDPNYSKVTGIPTDQMQKLWYEYEGLRTARLCHYLREKKADIVIEHTTFLFFLTAEDIANFTERSASTLPASAWE